MLKWKSICSYLECLSPSRYCLSIFFSVSNNKCLQNINSKIIQQWLRFVIRVIELVSLSFRRGLIFDNKADNSPIHVDFS